MHPMVAIEAIACGLPVVVFKDEALRGVVKNGINGYVTDDKALYVMSV